MDELPQDVLIEDDLLVVREVGGDGDEGKELRNGGSTADLVEEVLLTQGMGEGDGIDGEIFVVKLQQLFVDGAVGVVIKSQGWQTHAALAEAFNGVLQQAGEDAFFGFVAERQGTIE